MKILEILKFLRKTPDLRHLSKLPKKVEALEEKISSLEERFEALKIQSQKESTSKDGPSLCNVCGQYTLKRDPDIPPKLSPKPGKNITVYFWTCECGNRGYR